MKQVEIDSFWGGVIKSMGLVFGDVGTSPIYTLTVVFALTKPTYDNVLGILSLVVWTLTILVTVEYGWLATSLSSKGQGGEIVLREILLSHLKSGRAIAFAGFLTFIGVSLLLGDGVITPAITILSAVEGMLIIPGMENLNQSTLIIIAAAIAIALFVVQYRGSDRIAAAFGPIMLIWFSALAISGLASLLTMPDIIKIVNPWYAIKFFQHHGFAAFFVLSEVILCATGGEALYADMGHLGRRPIVRAWYFVFVALIINYLGQGVFALQHPGAKNLLFGNLKVRELAKGQINAPANSIGSDIAQDVCQLEGLSEVNRVVTAPGIVVSEDLDAQQADHRSDTIAVKLELVPLGIAFDV